MWESPSSALLHEKYLLPDLYEFSRVQLIKNRKKIAAFIPNDGCLNYIEENDKVLIAGFGRKVHAVGDIPEVKFEVSGVSLLALFKEKRRSQTYLVPGYTDRFMFLAVAPDGKTNASGHEMKPKVLECLPSMKAQALVQRTRQDSIGCLICSAKTFPPSINELGSQSGSEVLS
ncbi:hypothetical protein Bca52824_076131 [Brassica carinata]|uniref:S12 n=1 Tax=Brassica carinata TaxID=52824 RepID=A0A8X7PTG0_BRACI|nr:hypothetical protein Bca52824_076131 [Brassica carinata]